MDFALQLRDAPCGLAAYAPQALGNAPPGSSAFIRGQQNCGAGAECRGNHCQRHEAASPALSSTIQGLQVVA
jgi:hypothetical protein